jgi:hypothetical protein
VLLPELVALLLELELLELVAVLVLAEAFDTLLLDGFCGGLAGVGALAAG